MKPSGLCRCGNRPSECAACLRANGTPPAEPDTPGAVAPPLRSADQRWDWEWLLEAAFRLSEKRPLFTVEDLAVAAWELSPTRFGLRGFADRHPDNAKVRTLLYGLRGLAKAGWLRKVEGRFALTPHAAATFIRLAEAVKGAADA